MGRVRMAALLTAWTLSSAFTWAADSPNKVPFKLYRGYVIVVRGSIGGLKNLNFLVDTGAVPSVVDARIAQKLHLRGQPGRVDVPTKTLATERVTVPDVEVGPSHVGELPVIVQDLSFAEEALGTRVDAMIGFDVLGQSPFTIDYESRELVFGPVDPSFSTVPILPAYPMRLCFCTFSRKRLKSSSIRAPAILSCSRMEYATAVQPSTWLGGRRGPAWAAKCLSPGQIWQILTWVVCLGGSAWPTSPTTAPTNPPGWRVCWGLWR